MSSVAAAKNPRLKTMDSRYVSRVVDGALNQACATDEKGSDEGLDWYDRLLVETFPASDSLPLWSFRSRSGVEGQT